MKKFVVAAAAMLSMTCTSVFAQNEFAPEAGDLSLEVRFDPFGDDVFQLGNQAIKGRYFITDKDAVLLQLGFGVNSKKITPDTDNDQFYTKKSYGNFRFDLGYERHLVNYKRVDLFAGARLGYERRFASYKDVSRGSGNNGSMKEITTEVSNSDRDGHTGGNAFNMDIYTGIDFYVYKGLFVGAEFGLNLCTYSPLGTETRETDQETIKSKNAEREVSFKTYIVPAFRLGWTF